MVEMTLLDKSALGDDSTHCSSTPSHPHFGTYLAEVPLLFDKGTCPLTKA